MRIAPGTRALVAILGVIFLAVFAWMYIQANQTEVAFVYAKDLPPFEFISSADEFLKPVTVPANREFSAITDPRQIVGKYVGAQEVKADTLVQTPHLISELPSGQRDFPRALLPIDTYGYPISIPGNLGGIFRENDLIDIIAIIDEDGAPSPDDKAVLLFQKVRTLGIVEGKFIVAFTHEQIAAYEGWNRLTNVTFTAAINQEANPDFTPLYELEVYPTDQETLEKIFGIPTPTPEPVIEEESG